MPKRALGEFLDRDINKKYSLFYRCGYGKQKKYIYIGNYAKGNLFKFKLLKPEYVYLINGRHITPELYIPLHHDDIKEILTMLFKPMNCELIKLIIKSREEMADRIAKEIVIKRLKNA